MRLVISARNCFQFKWIQDALAACAQRPIAPHMICVGQMKSDIYMQKVEIMDVTSVKMPCLLPFTNLYSYINELSVARIVE